MSRRGAGCTLILLSLGAPARAYALPRRWPLWLAMFSALSICASLYAGHRARALFEAEITPRAFSARVPVLALPQPASFLRERFAAFAMFSPPSVPVSEGLLRLFDVNRKHELSVSPFTPDGHARPDAFAALRAFMACRRTGHTLDMDPALIALLLRISERYAGATLHVISAHRAVDGVVTSSLSQHARGTASDIRVPGVAVEALASAAKQLGARGVGVYHRNQFVHVDVRERPYFWREATRAAAVANAGTDELADGEAEGLVDEEAGELDGDESAPLDGAGFEALPEEPPRREAETLGTEPASDAVR